MNKTKIEWCDYTWNPITGCLNGCPYCYARKIAMRFTGHFNPALHVDRLGEPAKLRKQSIIFADSMSDFWGRGVKQEWRNSVYEAMKQAPQHKFILLTKQPQNIRDAKKIPENVWVGVSVTTFGDRWRIATLLTKIQKRILVSLEPLLTDNISSYVFTVNWVIVGALTGQKGFRPKDSTVRRIINECVRLDIPMFVKDNVGFGKTYQLFPEGLKS